LLDIGCGIGGPARWIAAKYGCRVTGVDLTAEFCAAARELNNLTGLADRVEILHGSRLGRRTPLPAAVGHH
jgi:cyclopropane fatty-acyl-phospholipid synthase-like methyltransferase